MYCSVIIMTYICSVIKHGNTYKCIINNKLLIMSDKKENMEGTDVKTDEVLEATETKQDSVSTSVASVSSNTPTVLTKSDLATLDYVDFSTPARMLALGEVLVKSQLVPLKKPEDVFVALQTGRDLGLPFITSVTQIYPINSRPTLGVHIMKGILLKSKILFEKTEDAVTIYEFVKADENGKTLMKEVTLKNGTKGKIPLEILGKGTLKEQPSSSTKRAVDTRTTYKFRREVKMRSGKFEMQTAYGSFSISDATQAELMEKEVWKKYWKRMLDARAFSIGAREIGDDLLLGLMTPEELGSDNIQEIEYTEG